MPKDEIDIDDPMEMVGVAIEGNFDVMADAIVDEFILMRFDEEALWGLFRNPFYRSTHAILLEKGEEYVHDLIRRGFVRWSAAAIAATAAAPQCDPANEAEGMSELDQENGTA